MAFFKINYKMHLFCKKFLAISSAYFSEFDSRLSLYLCYYSLIPFFDLLSILMSLLLSNFVAIT